MLPFPGHWGQALVFDQKHYCKFGITSGHAGSSVNMSLHIRGFFFGGGGTSTPTSQLIKTGRKGTAPPPGGLATLFLHLFSLELWGKCAVL